MLEIKLCRICARYRCAEHDDQIKKENRERPIVGHRACGDCFGYAPIAEMISKADGRVICQACQKAIDQRARDKAQADLFVTQPSLF